MNRSDQELLLDELLAGPEVTAYREASLCEGLRMLNRTRRRRRHVRVGAMVLAAVLSLSLFMVGRMSRPSGPVAVSLEQPAIVPALASATSSRTVDFISDEELLALFPNQSLALVGPQGRQQLVFLDRPVAN